MRTLAANTFVSLDRVECDGTIPVAQSCRKSESPARGQEAGLPPLLREGSSR